MATEAGRRTPLVKVCGLTSVANAVACVEAGADWIGLNFHPASSRFVSLEVAREIVRAIPPRARAVGLFVDRSADEVRSIADRAGITLVQLHGSEPVEDLERLRPLDVVKAFRLGDQASIEQMTAYLDETERRACLPIAALVDAFVPGRPGGTGVAIPTRLLERLPRIRVPLILAGGLTPENVAERARPARPWMVDVAGGVESSPGIKDPEAVRRFVAAAHEA